MSEAENESFTEWKTPTNSPASTKVFAENYILPYLKYTETGKDNFFYPNEELFYFKLAMVLLLRCMLALVWIS